jgi:hypothetical protein
VLSSTRRVTEHFFTLETDVRALRDVVSGGFVVANKRDNWDLYCLLDMYVGLKEVLET